MLVSTQMSRQGNLVSNCVLQVHFDGLQFTLCTSKRVEAILFNFPVYGSASICSFEILFNVQSTKLLLTPSTSAIRPIRIQHIQGMLAGKKAFGRNPTSLGALGSNCQYWERFQSDSAFS